MKNIRNRHLNKINGAEKGFMITRRDNFDNVSIENEESSNEERTAHN